MIIATGALRLAREDRDCVTTFGMGKLCEKEEQADNHRDQNWILSQFFSLDTLQRIRHDGNTICPLENVEQSYKGRYIENRLISQYR